MISIPRFSGALFWALGSLTTSAEILISQYYEGSAVNKWIELANTGEDAVSLDDYVLTRWSNARTESWRIDGSGPSSRDNLEGLSIPAQGFLLLGNRGSVLPTYAMADLATDNTPNFNGDDSVVLYDTSRGEVGSLAAIVDALSFTDNGNEGKDRSFYRISNDKGYDELTSGSTILDFPGVWGEKSNAEVDDASASDPWYLRDFNSSASESLVLSLSLNSIPENGGLGLVDVTVSRTGPTAAPLEVSLSSSDESEAVIPEPSREIPAGAESSTFPLAVGAVNDEIEDGTQTVTIAVSAPGFVDGAATLEVEDDGDFSPVVINEILADVPPGEDGDANADGETNSGDDEFVELVNKSGADLDMSGWELRDSTEMRHIFPAGTVVPVDCAIVVFGGGSVAGLGGAAIYQVVNTQRLGLNNGGDAVSLYDNLGELVASVTYGAEGDNAQSLTRDEDVSGSFAGHGESTGAEGSLFSPGTRVDGSEFCSPLGELTFSLSSATMSENGGSIVAELQRSGDLSSPLDVVIRVSDPSEAIADVGNQTSFPAGEASLVITLNAEDDVAQDGIQSVEIRAVAQRYFAAEAVFTVEDDGDGFFDSIVINEVLFDPPNPGGDANRDGTLETSQDEFVEFLNVSDGFFDLSRYEIHDGVGVRHIFPEGTILAAGRAIVVFGGGSPQGSFGGSLVQTASSGLLGLNNGGDMVILKPPGGGVDLLSLTYDGVSQDESLTRSPDGSGEFVAHSTVGGAAGNPFSPGTRLGGEDFDGAVEIGVIDIVSFEVKPETQEIIVAVAGLTSGLEYEVDVSVDLAATEPWFAFESFTTETGVEVSPGIFQFTLFDPFISQEDSQYYRIRLP